MSEHRRDFLGLSEVLLAAMRKSRHAVALFENKDGAGPVFSWASQPFCDAFALPKSAAGKSPEPWLASAVGTSVWSMLFGSKAVTFLASVGNRHWEACFEPMPAPDGGQSRWSALWLFDRTEEHLACLERDDLRKKLADGAALDEKSGFLAAKAFWKAVGAQWNLCGRKGICASLAFFTARSSDPAAPADPAALDEACALAVNAAFRRVSDLVGKLSENSFALFIADMDADAFTEQLAILQNSLPPGAKLFSGCYANIPKFGDTPKEAKIAAKKNLAKAMSGQGSNIVVSEN